jgi:hypothetical protein
MPRNYLLVIGDATALAWVLAEQRMAFPALRRSDAMALEIDDELFIYTTRSCFHNPTRDAGRVMGLAKVTTRVRDLAEPVVFGERRYTSGCALAIEGVAALREGVKLSPMVAELHIFPNPETWGMQLRRPLVPLDKHDATVLKRYLATLLEPLEHQLDAYLQAAKRRQMQQGSAATALDGTRRMTARARRPAQTAPIDHLRLLFNETSLMPGASRKEIIRRARGLWVPGCVG